MADSFAIKAKNRQYSGFERENHEKWVGPFYFIQAADTQLGMIENYIERKPNPGWDKEMQLIRIAVKAVNQMQPKPKFFVVCGDLVDAFPGTEFNEAQIYDYKEAFSQLSEEIPLVCVCGNHDVGDNPTPSTIEAYRNKFGDDYFVFWCQGVMFIVLNSQYYQQPDLVKDLAVDQDIWLDKILAEAKKYKHVVIFQHIPWFLREPNEAKDYFNINIDLRQKMLSKFNEAGVKAIFCGHYHRNAGGVFKNLEVVVTSAVGAQLGQDKNGLRVVKVQDSNIEHTYYGVDEIPSAVELQ